MNKEKLLNYISDPQMLNRDSMEEIQNLVGLFPYFQNAQLLFLFNLSNTQDIRFGEQLQKTATYAANRRLLKWQLEELKNPKVISSTEAASSIVASTEKESVVSPVDPLPPKTTDESNKSLDIENVDPTDLSSSVISENPIYEKTSEAESLEDLIEERNNIRSKAELLKLVKERLVKIEDALEEKEKEQSLKEKEVQEEVPLHNKLDLIDEFIRVEPRIPRPVKTAFFDPDTAAQESLFDDGAYVTETLARIYSDQGNYQKAAEIYQILSLNNPEKSAYFAALIQELENKLN